MLTSDCFDTCVDYPGQKLGSRAEKCITNCVERLIDTNNFVMNRMARLPTPSTSEINFD
ncbi:hypothetical protein FSP39_018792 [Pinctada imbricata]|uniref:Mitochondrial import inner membrane translocase subunit n=1 Tax=Pinctada imbricata TaxID=66713 RepID=A0AA88YF36_PINIB|nr:hypothetical protein FSP39_018792 [Pinctada imbricata]